MGLQSGEHQAVTGMEQGVMGRIYKGTHRGQGGAWRTYVRGCTRRTGGHKRGIYKGGRAGEQVESVHGGIHKGHISAYVGGTLAHEQGAWWCSALQH